MAILIVFSVSALLGFSMFINLRPAQGFTGGILAAIWHFVQNKIWEFVTAIAKSFIMKFVSSFMIKLLQKLESLHVIKNILYYSDALGFDVYLGSALNKAIVKPTTKEEADELEKDTNIGKIAFEAQQKFNLDPKQAEKLAYMSDQRGSIDLFLFKATKLIIKPGESTTLQWTISGDGLATANLCEDKVNLAGAKLVQPQVSTVYRLAVIGGDKKIVDTKNITIQVEGPGAPILCTLRTPGILPGLSASQEKNLLRGTLASMTSQAACGGTNSQLIQNMAIYNAAKVRGFDPRQIDPTSGNYYTYMARLGNPFASPEFQELAMRDMASSIDAQAQAAVQQELNSNGLKALRAEQNNITRSSDSIGAAIQEAMGNLFNQTSESKELSKGAQVVASSIGKFLAELVTSLIFKAKGTVITENPLCGIGVLASQDIYQGGISAGEIGSVGAANIAVNGQSAIGWKEGDGPVVLSWSVELTDETKNSTVTITNLPPECLSANFAPVNGVVNGSCQFTPTDDFTMELKLITGGTVDTYGVATVSIETPATPAEEPDGGTSGEVGTQKSEISPAFRVRE